MLQSDAISLGIYCKNVRISSLITNIEFNCKRLFLIFFKSSRGFYIASSLAISNMTEHNIDLNVYATQYVGL